jgi:ABC-2 type transport system permease protein
MTIILQVLFILIVCTVFYIDKISEFFNLDLHQPIEIKLEHSLRKEIKNEDEWKSQGFIFTNNPNIVEINKVDNVYQIMHVQELNTQQRIYELLLSNHKRTLENENNLDWLEKYNTINVEFIDSSLDEKPFKQQLIILFLTSIYFMMLNFIAVNSNEIIMEKTSHMIPLILSSVTIKVHFLTKLIIGFCSVLFQIVSSIGIIGLIGYLRYKLDLWQGLIKLVLKFMPIPIEQISFTEIIKLLDLKTSDLKLVLLGLTFILLGIFLIQICILILSSKVKTMEEAASIQGPFYLVLLIIYYLALSLNTTHALSNGIGYFLSFVPVFSMLIMPMRLLTSHVMPIEVLVSILFTIAIISLIFIVLYPQYELGLKNEQ